MNDQFDELTKGMAQSVTRRGALKKFGVGFAGIALATLGLANRAEAGDCANRCKHWCAQNFKRNTPEWEACWTSCAAAGCF